MHLNSPWSPDHWSSGSCKLNALKYPNDVIGNVFNFRASRHLFMRLFWVLDPIRILYFTR